MSCKESTAVALCAPYLDMVGIAFIEFHPTVKTTWPRASTTNTENSASLTTMCVEADDWHTRRGCSSDDRVRKALPKYGGVQRRPHTGAA